jgi:hypothetical protein
VLRAEIVDEHDVDEGLVEQADDHGVAVRGDAEGGCAVVWVSREEKTVAKSHVVFRNYQGRYFLAEIWASGQEKGRELLETREEQQLAKRQEMTAVNVPLSSGGSR